ncbi:hypothetical protein BP6252_03578 [Coleophoma cylindrospora]|uniref:Uncharacterized protein n=1 Tax=Coleophoma cylindrospora TaxID=1849047 RepID=A0A3D8S825_9HELO|nr:hypothetical protein BP6252_03578 [Coleophoma cylindrospora]
MSSTTNFMSDEDLDRDWKPSSTRPQSTMARSFSAALNDLFKLDDNSIVELDRAVDKKKQAVSTQTSELEALEARLRATEERLKAAAENPRRTLSGRSVEGGTPQTPRERVPLSDTASQGREAERSPASPLAQKFVQVPSRPGTGKGDGMAMPGAMPPTPGASEGMP